MDDSSKPRQMYRFTSWQEEDPTANLYLARSSTCYYHLASELKDHHQGRPEVGPPNISGDQTGKLSPLSDTSSFPGYRRRSPEHDPDHLRSSVTGVQHISLVSIPAW